MVELHSYLRMHKHSKENINLLQKLKQFNGEEQHYRHPVLWYVTRSGRITAEASPCLIEPVLASSRTDLPVAKVEPMSDSGSTSGITCLRMGKKLHNSNFSRRNENI